MSTGDRASQDAAALEGLGLEDLRSIWRLRFGAPPRLRSPELLALMLAYRIQAEAYGGASPSLRAALKRSPTAKSEPALGPGSILTREWQGEEHTVTVLAGGGFVYAGEVFKSLSQIARRIAGTRWNGPRFFGLRDGQGQT